MLALPLLPLLLLLLLMLMLLLLPCHQKRGYTRKEKWTNNFLGISWSPMAENWNGR